MVASKKNTLHPRCSFYSLACARACRTRARANKFEAARRGEISAYAQILTRVRARVSTRKTPRRKPTITRASANFKSELLTSCRQKFDRAFCVDRRSRLLFEFASKQENFSVATIGNIDLALHRFWPRIKTISHCVRIEVRIKSVLNVLAEILNCSRPTERLFFVCSQEKQQFWCLNERCILQT